MALIDYVVLVPVWDEWQEVIPILGGARARPRRRNERSYQVWQVPVDARPDAATEYLVAAVRMAIWTPGQSTAAAATTQALADWRPARLVLVGIAGSLEPNKIMLGDVVVPDHVIGYEISDALGRDKRRVRVTPSETNQLDLERIVEFRDDSVAYAAWKDDCLRDSARFGIGPARPPELHITSTASGNEVVRSVAAGLQLRKWLNSDYVEAVEMEARGVDRAVYSEPNHPDVLMVRGISDYADADKQKLDAAGGGGWRRYAAANAARVVAAYLSRGPVAPISPGLTLDVTRAGYDRFAAPDVPQDVELGRDGAQNISFPLLLRRSGSTPAVSITVAAMMSNGKPSATYRGIALIDRRSTARRTTVWGSPLSDGRLQFDIPENEGGYDLELLLAFPVTVARLEITCVDVFARTATRLIDFSVL